MSHYEMPENWDDREQWDRYWTQQLQEVSYPQNWVSLRHEPELRFLGFVRSQPQRKVWFAGCGISVAPILYAYAGCDVLATDISSVAIQFLERMAQQSIGALVRDLEEINAELELKETRATYPRFRIHDFRQALDESDFDVVLNIKAYQALSTTSMKQASNTFYQALKPGGHAIFDTQNVQGQQRNEIEDLLLDAGFYIPFHKSERWYREQLNSTGILYVMVLGRPMIPQWGQYGDGDFNKQADRDRKILRSFDREYHQRKEQEASEVKAMMDDRQTKIARVVYNTG